MNRYTFCFTKKELKEFSIRAVLEQYRRRGRVWVILLLLCVLEAFISPAFSVVILFLFAAALGVDMFRTCRFLEKEFSALFYRKTVTADSSVLWDLLHWLYWRFLKFNCR